MVRRGNVAKAQTKDNLKALSRLTHQVDGVLQIVSDPPLVVPIEELIGNGVDRGPPRGRPLAQLLTVYGQTLRSDRTAPPRQPPPRYVDLARKVVMEWRRRDGPGSSC